MDDDEIEENAELAYANIGTVVGDNYPACDKTIMTHGVIVMVSTMDKEGTEATVARLRSEGFDVDWHWNHSRAVVKALPDQDIPKLRARFSAACDKFHAELQRDIDNLNRKRNTN